MGLESGTAAVGYSASDMDERALVGGRGTWGQAGFVSNGEAWEGPLKSWPLGAEKPHAGPGRPGRSVRDLLRRAAEGGTSVHKGVSEGESAVLCLRQISVR